MTKQDCLSLRVALWNVEWTRPRSRRADVIRRYLGSADPDIICLTESYSDMLAGGYQIEAEEDYGYPVVEGRRKVLQLSKWAWRLSDRVGSPTLPQGRYVSGVTETPLGLLQITGVCIPWSGAHVSTGRRDRTRWEDHLSYLEGLRPLLRAEPSKPHILLGDFNQTVPRGSQPKGAFEVLTEALTPWLELATAGVVDTTATRRSIIWHIRET